VIDIVLATYNGERYLAEQIESIQGSIEYSSLVNRLIVVDDGSTDKTPEIVKRLLSKDNKIEWHLNSSGKSGPANNFSFGLSLTTSDYIMLCDQDDIWLPSKINTSIIELLAIERKLPDKPVLVFSDKLIVDEQLNIISRSYFQLKKIPFDWYLSFENICQQNVGSGCTMIFNRKLLDMAVPIPKKAYMHDWWLMLVASKVGRIELIKTPLIKYRQHQNNTIGVNQISIFKKVWDFKFHFERFKQSLSKIINQAQAFKEFEKKHGLQSNDTINSLAKILTLSRFDRIKLVLNKSIFRSHPLGNVTLLLVLLYMKVIPKNIN